MTTLTIEADGGSRGNPGPAGYGALVREGSLVLAERGAAIGVATNNVAEYRGLIAGLEAAQEIDPTAQLEVRMDSKLVVEQMSGRWKIKHSDMQKLAAQAAKLVATFPRVNFTWIPRAQNSAADALANAAMDAAAAGKVFEPAAVVLPEQPTLTEAAVAGLRPVVASNPSLGSGWGRPSGAPTSTVLLRHGQTALSVDRRFSGVGSDPELTEEGRGQASGAGERLRSQEFDAIISSPLRRARQTAELVATIVDGPREVIIEDGIRETDFGDWEGLTFSEVDRKWPQALAAWLADPAVAPPGGESFVDTDKRVGEAIEGLRDRYPGARLLVVSHVTPIKLLVRRALDAPLSALYRMHLDLASITSIDWYADGPAVVRGLNI
jgi:broad specificity phosphatase PhoE/ribonuclease HI